MRRGIVNLSYEALFSLLLNPDDKTIEIENVVVDSETRTISLYLVGSDESMDLYKVTEGTNIPVILRLTGNDVKRICAASFEELIPLSPDEFFGSIIRKKQ